MSRLEKKGRGCRRIKHSGCRGPDALATASGFAENAILFEPCKRGFDPFLPSRRPVGPVATDRGPQRPRKDFARRARAASRGLTLFRKPFTVNVLLTIPAILFAPCWGG